MYLDQISFIVKDFPLCSPYLHMFSCATILPKCSADGNGRVPPCRSLCESEWLVSRRGSSWKLTLI